MGVSTLGVVCANLMTPPKWGVGRPPPGSIEAAPPLFGGIPGPKFPYGNSAPPKSPPIARHPRGTCNKIIAGHEAAIILLQLLQLGYAVKGVHAAQTNRHWVKSTVPFIDNAARPCKTDD